MNNFIIAESSDNKNQFYIFNEDIKKTFFLEKTKEYIPQLKIEADSKEDAMKKLEGQIESNDISIVNDVLYEEEVVDNRKLERGDFVKYRFGEGEQEITFLTILETPLFLQSEVKCFDPWHDKYLIMPVSELTLLTKREKSMMVNHHKHGMNVVGETMINVSERVLNINVDDSVFLKPIKKQSKVK